jgi:hypothetical protein
MSLKHWFAAWRPQRRKPRPSGRYAAPRRVRLHLEPLEDRIVPALGNPQQAFADPRAIGGDNFGTSVAVSGTEVLVGAYGVNGGRGAAYLYNTDGILLHTFSDPNNTALDAFGFAVALSGTDVLVGANGANGFRGAAYHYSTDGTLLQPFYDENNTVGDFFGSSVALAGGDVLVGASGFGLPGTAFLYGPDGRLLEPFADPTGGANDQFGISVALSESAELVGANGVNGSAGAAYLYPDGAPMRTFADPNGTANDQFGVSVAMSGSDVLVGANAVNGSAGAAYLYNTDGTLLQTFADPSGISGDNFGIAVALSGTDVLVGAYTVKGSSGAAYLYNTDGTLLQTFTDPSGTVNDLFGHSVAVSGTDVLVGGNQVNGVRGAAYLYGIATALSAVNGNNQGAPLATNFSTLSEVQVIDALGNPVSGAHLTFTEADGSGGAGGSFSGATTVTTNSQGIAYGPRLTANATAGAFTVTAANGAVSTTFYLTNLPGPATQLAVADAPATVIAGQGFSFQVDVEDAFGNLVNGNHSVVSVTLGGPGAFTAGSSSAQAIDDVASFYGMAIQKTGSYTLSFTNSSLAGISVPLTVVPAAPATITAVSGSTPQNAEAGQPFATALAVVVIDAFGNPVGGVPFTFTTPASGASGSFTGSATVTTDVTGTATANSFTANTAVGSYSVFAQAASGDGPAATFALTNLPGPAAGLVVANNPATVIAGQDFSFEADIEDAFGNLVPGDQSNVTVTLAGPGPFSAGSTTAQVIDDVASFYGMTIQKAGSYTLSLSDNNLTGISVPLTVTAADPVAIAPVQGTTPQKTAVGQPFGTALAAVVTDVFGNPVSGVQVSFSVPASKGAGATFGGAITVTVTTDDSGQATALALTANTKLGSYTVSATAPGLAKPATFKLTNTAAKAHVLVHLATQKSAAVHQRTVMSIVALVTDAHGKPISGAVVTFRALPGSAADVSFNGHANATARTTRSGTATSPVLKLNGRPARFSVMVTIGGLSTEVTLDLA